MRNAMGIREEVDVREHDEGRRNFNFLTASTPSLKINKDLLS